MMRFLADWLRPSKAKIVKTAKTAEKVELVEMPQLVSRAGVVDSRICGLVDNVQSGWFRQDSGELLEGFAITSADVVLDVGCGEGGATMFAARCGAHVIFSDTDAAQVERLSAKVAESPARGAQPLVCDTNPLPLPDGCASRIIAMEMLEHVDDPAQVLAELVRVGQPGALYLLTVPDPVGEGLQKKLAPASHFQKPNHIHVFEREAFAALVSAAGLQIERRHASGFFWSLWMCLYWASKPDSDGSGNGDMGATRDNIKPPYPPLLDEWAKTWHQLISLPEGARIKQVLDSVMPKSQAIIARKPHHPDHR
ncbi:class I SAM-dependent methyltransferase [Collimonas sp.]|jgi:SAM-dependent methyltransferase|uniref:class I SAM-dependent methyltransferase n=1 Tax=Collimonas sp. TaxID=1963772 RepID=UPI002C9B889F|nr:class I SAM-dependent methyltransferase [Collimonas sp.]HWW08055.1 class I SAM-dependent methyltransferase [Collimonas sp.]